MPEQLSLAQLNDAPVDVASRLLIACCGCRRWVDAMVAARPYGALEEVYATAERAWLDAPRADVMEAMSHHPRIGELAGAGADEATEQAGAASADDQIKAALAVGNHAYETRFGYIYLVCAAGKSGHELLGILRARLENDPETELAVAAGEQAKITQLRIAKLLAS